MAVADEHLVAGFVGHGITVERFSRLPGICSATVSAMMTAPGARCKQVVGAEDDGATRRGSDGEGDGCHFSPTRDSGNRTEGNEGNEGKSHAHRTSPPATSFPWVVSSPVHTGIMSKNGSGRHATRRKAHAKPPRRKGNGFHLAPLRLGVKPPTLPANSFALLPSVPTLAVQRLRAVNSRLSGSANRAVGRLTALLR